MARTPISPTSRSLRIPNGKRLPSFPLRPPGPGAPRLDLLPIASVAIALLAWLVVGSGLSHPLHGRSPAPRSAGQETSSADEDSRGGTGVEGERLFIALGCMGCHGASGRGGVGPDLARTELGLDAFVDQVRAPTGVMPPFPTDLVSREQLRTIHGFLRELPRPPERLRAAELPSGELSPESCDDCHAQYQPGIVRQFSVSAMGASGRQNPRIDLAMDSITCAACHGTDHDRIMKTGGRVPEETCARCHPDIYEQNTTSGGHSYGPGPGDLGINWERNIGVPHYQQMPRKVMEMGCDPCHAVAGATGDRYWSDEQLEYVDSSSLPYRNGCDSCHSRHAFDLEEARKPESCRTCHMGPDHPNFEAYMSSKHGTVYQVRGENWNWDRPITRADWETPTCAYCHMLSVGEDGERTSSHDVSGKIIWGMGVQPATGQLTDITRRPENLEKRTAMVRVCMTCHSEDKARGYLKSADAHKLAGDALVVDARDILKGLYEDGLIAPSHGRKAAGLLPGPEFTAIELPSEFAQHWPTGLFFDVNEIELEYFDMFFFSNLKSYKGAFHMSPDYAWWYGYAATLGHLARIRDQAEQLRESQGQ